MKKIVVFLIVLISPFMVKAKEESAKVIPIVPRCVYVTDKEIIVPIEVISKNEGIIDSRFPEYILGKVENNSDNIKIKNKEYKEFNINIDGLKDSNNYSNVYFSLNKLVNTRKYKEMGKVMNFNIVFNVEEIPSKLYVLGTEIIISKDKNICKKINNYNSKELNDKAIILNESNYVYILIIGMLGIIIMVLIKRSDKRAIH